MVSLYGKAGLRFLPAGRTGRVRFWNTGNYRPLNPGWGLIEYSGRSTDGRRVFAESYLNVRAQIRIKLYRQYSSYQLLYCMKTLLFEELTQLFPHLSSESLERLYQRPFHPQLIFLYFKEWEFYEPYSRYIDSSEERNVIWFEEHTYCINGTHLPFPETLGEFIENCRTVGVELFWNKTASLIWSRAITDNLVLN